MKVSLKPLNPRSPDTKYVGEEPLWRNQPTEDRFTALSRAFNWYNYFYGKKEAKDFVAVYLDANNILQWMKKSNLWYIWFHYFLFHSDFCLTPKKSRVLG